MVKFANFNLQKNVQVFLTYKLKIVYQNLGKILNYKYFFKNIKNLNFV